jgi:hypothetical protein
MIPLISCVKPYTRIKGGEIIYFLPTQVDVKRIRSRVSKTGFKDLLNPFIRRIFQYGIQQKAK